jgi:hypothetical protein
MDYVFLLNASMIRNSLAKGFWNDVYDTYFLYNASIGMARNTQAKKQSCNFGATACGCNVAASTGSENVKLNRLKCYEFYILTMLSTVNI